MTIEELIRKRFLGIEEIAGRLAVFAGQPAVFLQVAPADVQAGWKDGTQYPRIVNYVELRTDNERKSQGLLRVDLLCDIEKDVPEDIEPLIRASLKDILFQPDDGSPYCFAWQRTDSFEIESKNSDKRIAGYEIVFDILEYPEQITTEPDPVETMNLFLKEKLPEAFIVGMDQMEEFRVATEDSPIVYVRMVQYDNDRTTYALSWMNCKLAIHIIAPTAGTRSKWIRQAMNWLATEGEAIMPNDTPMLFNGMSANNGMDYLVNGQITVDAQYALTRLRQESPALWHPNINE